MVVSWLRWWCLPKSKSFFSHFHHGSHLGWAKPKVGGYLFMAFEGFWLGVQRRPEEQNSDRKATEDSWERRRPVEDNWKRRRPVVDPSSPWRFGTGGTILVGKATALDCQWEKYLLQGSAEHKETQVMLSFPTTVQCLGFTSTPWPGRAQPLFAASLHNLQSQKNISELNWCYVCLASKNT